MNYTAFYLKYKLKKAEMPHFYCSCAIIIPTTLILLKKNRHSWQSLALSAVPVNQIDGLFLTDPNEF